MTALERTSPRANAPTAIMPAARAWEHRAPPWPEGEVERLRHVCADALQLQHYIQPSRPWHGLGLLTPSEPRYPTIATAMAALHSNRVYLWMQRKLPLRVPDEIPFGIFHLASALAGPVEALLIFRGFVPNDSRALAAALLKRPDAGRFTRQARQLSDSFDDSLQRAIEHSGWLLPDDGERATILGSLAILEERAKTPPRLPRADADPLLWWALPRLATRLRERLGSADPELLLALAKAADRPLSLSTAKRYANGED